MNNPFTFSYLGVVDEQFAVFPEYYRTGETVQPKVSLTFPYDFNERKVGCEMTVDFHLPEKPIYLRCGVTCVFQFDATSWNTRRISGTDAIDLEEDVLVHFAAFTAGTLRGVLHVRQQSRPVMAILPPVNVYDLLKNERGNRRLVAEPTR